MFTFICEKCGAIDNSECDNNYWIAIVVKRGGIRELHFLIMILTLKIIYVAKIAVKDFNSETRKVILILRDQVSTLLNIIGLILEERNVYESVINIKMT